jgi:hypothetical protein
MFDRTRLTRLFCAVPICLALCTFATSCGGDKPDSKGASTGSLADDMPVPPADAQYTLMVRDFPEPSHVQDSRDAQNLLRQSTGMKDWYIVHSENHSTLYYGYYRCIDPRDPKDGAEGQRAINDQNKVRAITDSDGNRLFGACLLLGIDTPDPQENPAWDITRTNGYWSIEVAVFTHSADRKQRAVDAVREARNEGYEAYYYHGPTASSVCIGSWPAEAAVEIDTDKQNVDPDKPLVVTNTPLAPEIAGPLQKSNIQTIAPHVDVQDLTLTKALGQWKEHAVNGYTLMQTVIDPVTHQQTTQPERPFLFKIPHDQNTPNLANNDSPVIAPPVQTPDPGIGQLRGLGE